MDSPGDINIELFSSNEAPEASAAGDELCRLTLPVGQTLGSEIYHLQVKNSGTAAGELRADLSKSNNKVFCEIRGDLSPGSLAFALWIVYAFYGIGKMRVPIHSSAVVCNNFALLFLGESGIGKSTQASLWLRHIAATKALNDDSPVLSIGADGKTYVYGSPWSGKGRVYLNESYPVAAFVRLEQGSDNHIVRVHKLEAFRALFPSFPPQFMQFDHFEECACNIISVLIGSIPVYKLRCLPCVDAAILTHSAVFNNKEGV